MTVRERRGRCRWCYNHGTVVDGARRDPPKGEVQAREERRVYVHA